MNMKRTFGSILTVSLLLGITGIALSQSKKTKAESNDTAQAKNPRVTFVELGSVKCIPCRQMQPVMKAIEQKYGDQVKVVFHDVWKDEGSSQAEAYKIKLIPTQVFLDAKGKEFFRHEGFYPEAEIDKLLQKRGLKVRSGG
jgi:thioredoxin 1